jgi:hypothetical protein
MQPTLDAIASEVILGSQIETYHMHVRAGRSERAWNMVFNWIDRSSLPEERKQGYRIALANLVSA